MALKKGKHNYSPFRGWGYPTNHGSDNCMAEINERPRSKLPGYRIQNTANAQNTNSHPAASCEEFFRLKWKLWKEKEVNFIIQIPSNASANENEVKLFEQQKVRTHWMRKRKNGIAPFPM